MDQQKLKDPPKLASRDSINVDDLDVLRQSPGKDGFNEILMKYRSRLRKIVSMRINHRLQGRVDASDVIQHAYMEASRTLDNYLADPKLPVFLWLRQLANEKLIQVHRFHLSAQKRNADRDFLCLPRCPIQGPGCSAGDHRAK